MSCVLHFVCCELSTQLCPVSQLQKASHTTRASGVYNRIDIPHVPDLVFGLVRSSGGF